MMFPNFLDRDNKPTYKFKRTRRSSSVPEGSFYKYRRNKWLHDERFEASLEEDNIDEDIVQTEVSRLQEEWQNKTKRKKLVKVLQSNPAQIAVSVLVLIDVLLMVALLLIDVHVLKDKMAATGVKLNHAVEFFRVEYQDKLANYTGDDIDSIIKLLKNNGPVPETENNHHKRSIDYTFYAIQNDINSASGESVFNVRTVSGSNPEGGIEEHDNPTYGDSKTIHVRQLRSSDRATHSNGGKVDSGSDSRYGGSPHVDNGSEGVYAGNGTDGGAGHAGDDHGAGHDGGDHLMEHLSHIFHISSIVILGIMVAEVLFKMAVIGKHFFDWKDGKLEIMDAIVVTVSFTLDLIFYKGIFATGISEATTLLLIFLIWRMIQVFNGVISTTKRRLEFRIRLQKKARRQAEEKLANTEEQNHLLQEEIKSLRSLCRFHTVPEDDIANCKPIVSTRGRCHSTSLAVSSILRMSVGFVRHLSRNDAAQTSCDSDQKSSRPSSPNQAETAEEDTDLLKTTSVNQPERKSPKPIQKMDTVQEDTDQEDGDEESGKSDYGSDISDERDDDERSRKPPPDSGVGSSMEGSEKPDDSDILLDINLSRLNHENELPLTRSRSDYLKKGRRQNRIPLLSELALDLPKYPKKPTRLHVKDSCSLSLSNLAEHVTNPIIPQNISHSVGNNLNKRVVIIEKGRSRHSLKRQQSFDDNTAVDSKPSVIREADRVVNVEELDQNGEQVLTTTL